jgi:hypothetical protein
MISIERISAMDDRSLKHNPAKPLMRCSTTALKTIYQSPSPTMLPIGFFAELNVKDANFEN